MPRPRQATPSPSVATTTTANVLSSLLSIVSSAVQTSDLVSSTTIGTTTTTSAAASVSSSTSSRSTRQIATTVVAATTQTSPSPTPSSAPLSTTLSSPPSTTTQIASSSSPPSQATQTTITSSFITYIDGSTPLATQTTFPSTIPQLSTPSSSQRTAIIAGSAAGGTAFLILVLSLAFFARRKQFKHLDFIQAISLKRKQEQSRATFLDGEDLDDVRLPRPPQGYTDYDTPWDGSQRALIPRTQSKSGSAFKEELWPPPNTNPNAHEASRLIEPLDYRDDPELDLSRIVDNVMGPSSSGMHFPDWSVASIHRGSVVESEGVVHSRTVSDASNIALLEAAGLGGPAPVTVRSSPLAQPGTRPAESFEHDDPSLVS